MRATTVVTPVTAEMRVIVQLPVPPTVVHGFADVNAPGPESDREADLRAVGRVHEPPPVPVFTFTCAVNVCVVPTRFVAVGGVIWMFASTNVLTASAEFGATPSVATVNGVGRRPMSVEDAWPVTLPAVGE